MLPLPLPVLRLLLCLWPRLVRGRGLLAVSVVAVTVIASVAAVVVVALSVSVAAVSVAILGLRHVCGRDRPPVC